MIVPATAVLPAPPAIQTLPFHAMEVQLVEKTEKPRPFHVVPFTDHAKLFVPAPPASHIWPFHASALTLVVNTLLPPATAVKADVPVVDDAI
jgi:hypothetical protein